MAQTFEYPNIMSWTDEWSDWWEPEIGVTNSCHYFPGVIFQHAWAPAEWEVWPE